VSIVASLYEKLDTPNSEKKKKKNKYVYIFKTAWQPPFMEDQTHLLTLEKK